MLTLYDAPRCPFCARVRIALGEKDVPYERVEIDLADRPDWLYEKNALGRVPVLEEGDFVLPESTVILEYLEDRYPDPPLLPVSPEARALARLRIERFDHALGGAYYALRREEDGAADRLAECLAAFDRGLAERDEAFGLVDIAYLPWIVRLRESLGVELADYPAILARLERLAARPSVAAELAVVASL